MHYWKIDRDYLDLEPYGITSRVGTSDGDPPSDPATLVRFRVKDDDGNVYYGGEATDESLEDVLAYTQADAGATELEVKEGQEWKLVIG